jgi:hypothetical protein
MTTTVTAFCPSVDALTLLQLRSEAFQAWMAAPSHQEDTWRRAYALTSVLLAQASAGPVRLDLR